jgi:hypothetical protein
MEESMSARGCVQGDERVRIAVGCFDSLIVSHRIIKASSLFSRSSISSLPFPNSTGQLLKQLTQTHQWLSTTTISNQLLNRRTYQSSFLSRFAVE